MYEQWSPNWHRPHTSLVSMTYEEWLAKARNVGDADSEHFYLQTSDFGHNRYCLIGIMGWGVIIGTMIQFNPLCVASQHRHM